MTAFGGATASKCSWIARRRNIGDRAIAHTDRLIEDQERLDQTGTTDLLLLLVLVTNLIDHVGGVLECLVEVVQLFVGVGVVINLELFHSRRASSMSAATSSIGSAMSDSSGPGASMCQWVVDHKSASALREDTKT
jgi:hypothetical protein